jgi:cell division protein FtsL
MEDLQQKIRMLEGEVGNLQVQVSEYQQIVKELSDKLKLYDQVHGAVFMPSTKK